MYSELLSEETSRSFEYKTFEEGGENRRDSVMVQNFVPEGGGSDADEKN